MAEVCQSQSGAVLTTVTVLTVWFSHQQQQTRGKSAKKAKRYIHLLQPVNDGAWGLRVVCDNLLGLWCAWADDGILRCLSKRNSATIISDCGNVRNLIYLARFTSWILDGIYNCVIKRTLSINVMLVLHYLKRLTKHYLLNLAIKWS